MAIAITVIIGSAVLSTSKTGRRLEGLSLLVFSAAVGILSVAALGLVVVSLPFPYGINARVGLASVVTLAALQSYKYNSWRRLLRNDIRWTLLGIGSWLLLTFIALGTTYVPVHFPNPLPDGPYVIKNERLHVKIQRMLGDFPADNYIPFIAGEFLLKDIQFASERPLMPGQEFSNRPILLSLAVIPIHAALIPPITRVDPLPKFRYVGSRWPDVGVLGDDVTYRSFLRVAVAYNATLVLALVLLLRLSSISLRLSVIACFSFVSSPYFLGQTLFIWPKSLAAFLLLVSAYTLMKRRRTYVAAIFAASAYWAHPFAIVFIPFFIFYLVWRERNDADLQRGAMPFALAAALILAPWFIWTRLYLQIPSDLVEQNMFSSDIGQALSARVTNLGRTFLAPPADWGSIEGWTRAAIVSLAGAVGPLLCIPVLFGIAPLLRRNITEFVLFAMAPSLLLVAVFGNIALPALHGLQLLATLLLLAAFAGLDRLPLRPAAFMLGTAQIFLNVALLVYHGIALGFAK
jgi:hypothetical protein